MRETNNDVTIIFKCLYNPQFWFFFWKKGQIFYFLNDVHNGFFFLEKNELIAPAQKYRENDALSDFITFKD